MVRRRGPTDLWQPKCPKDAELWEVMCSLTATGRYRTGILLLKKGFLFFGQAELQPRVACCYFLFNQVHRVEIKTNKTTNPNCFTACSNRECPGCSVRSAQLNPPRPKDKAFFTAVYKREPRRVLLSPTYSTVCQELAHRH